MPVRYVGETVTVHESAAAYEIFFAGVSIARHAKAPRHSMIMEPSHYRGLLRTERDGVASAPPKWDPAYLALGEVFVRDLAVYQALVEERGGAL